MCEIDFFVCCKNKHVILFPCLKRRNFVSIKRGQRGRRSFSVLVSGGKKSIAWGGGGCQKKIRK
jgi:hypothetical protein